MHTHAITTADAVSLACKIAQMLKHTGGGVLSSHTYTHITHEYAHIKILKHTDDVVGIVL
jgi:hypothetical protein